MEYYTEADARFDYEQLNGPLCPKHGKDCSLCCRECGRENERHEKWCHLREDDWDDQDILYPMPPDYEPCGDCGHNHSYEYEQAFKWHKENQKR